MATERSTGSADPETRPAPRAGFSEYVVAVLLAALGVLVLAESTTISQAGSGADPLGPRAAPYLVGGLLLVVSVLLALDIARGGRG